MTNTFLLFGAAFAGAAVGSFITSLCWEWRDRIRRRFHKQGYIQDDFGLYGLVGGLDRYPTSVGGIDHSPSPWWKNHFERVYPDFGSENVAPQADPFGWRNPNA